MLGVGGKWQAWPEPISPRRVDAGIEKTPIFMQFIVMEASENKDACCN